jgi:hypothetical protein
MSIQIRTLLEIPYQEKWRKAKKHIVNEVPGVGRCILKDVFQDFIEIPAKHVELGKAVPTTRVHWGH